MLNVPRRAVLGHPAALRSGHWCWARAVPWWVAGEAIGVAMKFMQYEAEGSSPVVLVEA
jgi:hypothetical protein